MTGCFGKFDLQNICESIYDKTRPPMFTDIEELEYQGKDYMLTARVYEAVKSDIEYTRDKTIQYIRAKEMIIEYIKKMDQPIGQRFRNYVDLVSNRLDVHWKKCKRNTL